MKDYKDERTFYSDLIKDTWLLYEIIDDDFNHLPKVGFVRFICCKVAFFQPFILYSLEGSDYAKLTLKKWGFVHLFEKKKSTKSIWTFSA